MTGGDIITSGGLHPERQVRWPPTKLMMADAAVLANRVTQLLQAYTGAEHIHDGAEPAISSGYRPPEVNAATEGAAKRSNHMVCRAVDIHDHGGTLAKWCLANLDLLEHLELWMEAPRYTYGWVHLQSVPPRSNNRVFIP